MQSRALCVGQGKQVSLQVGSGPCASPSYSNAPLLCLAIFLWSPASSLLLGTKENGVEQGLQALALVPTDPSLDLRGGSGAGS